MATTVGGKKQQPSQPARPGGQPAGKPGGPPARPGGPPARPAAPPAQPPVEENLPEEPPEGYGEETSTPPSTDRIAAGMRSVAAELVRYHADGLCAALGIDRQTMAELLSEAAAEFGGGE